jgi:hypothetical protein
MIVNFLQLIQFVNADDFILKISISLNRQQQLHIQ